MELRTTIVFVTHSIQEAILLADRVAVLSPRPGQMRRVLDVDIPRPRSFGHNAHLEQVADISAELHELLLAAPMMPPPPPRESTDQGAASGYERREEYAPQPPR
jgi:NitT/TauT family transport system ATP-binding protein